MRNTVLWFLLLMFLMPLSTAQEAVFEEDWSQFRGPGGQGHASARSPNPECFFADLWRPSD